MVEVLGIAAHLIQVLHNYEIANYHKPDILILTPEQIDCLYLEKQPRWRCLDTTGFIYGVRYATIHDLKTGDYTSTKICDARTFDVDEDIEDAIVVLRNKERVVAELLEYNRKYYEQNYPDRYFDKGKIKEEIFKDLAWRL